MNKKLYIYLCALSHMATDTAQGGLPALLPLFIGLYGLNYQEAAALMFANTALASVAQPLLGYLSDKYPMPWMTALGVFLTGISIGFMSIADNYWSIFSLAVLAGLGSAAFHPETARLVNRLSAKQKGKSMGTFAVGGSAGFAIGPLLAGTSYVWGIHMLWLFPILNTLIALALLYAIRTLDTKMATDANQSKDSATISTQIQEHVQHNTKPLSEPTNDWRSFTRLFGLILTRATNYAVLNTFIPIYWITILHQSTTSGNLALTIFFFIGIIITLVGGILSDKFGYVKIIRISYLFMVPSMFFFTNSNTYLWSLFLLLPLGFGLFCQYSPIVVLGQTYLAKSVGFAAGITLGVGITFGGIVAPGIGWFADHYGLQSALQVLNIVTLIGLVLSFMLKETTKTSH